VGIDVSRIEVVRGAESIGATGGKWNGRQAASAVSARAREILQRQSE